YKLQVKYGLEVPGIHLPIAVIAAHRGQLELARAHSQRSLQLGEEQIGLHTPVHLGTLGGVALQDGDPHAALDWFVRAGSPARGGRETAPPAARSARPSASSSGSARRPGSRRPARSSAGSAGAPARRA